MSQALYRKYRSRKLSDVIGQKHITDILEQALKTGQIAHAYLFSGPRGVGKTSIARILAHEINSFEYSGEDSHLDIIEVDAASNSKVDEMRELTDKVAIAPTRGKKKVYIIDEVHMLSNSAFNAMLKTLEEPPEHIVFILATTDAHKVPVTVLSRAQKFVFHLVAPETVAAHLKMIAKSEKISIDEAALALIAERGGGSVRDSITLLDQVQNLAEAEASGGNTTITREKLESYLGLANVDMVKKLLQAYVGGNNTEAIGQAEEFFKSGLTPEVVAGQLIRVILKTGASGGEKAAKLYQLADKLTEVGRSNYPEVKLLAALAG